jgi:molybdopterin molybdotransferase
LPLDAVHRLVLAEDIVSGVDSPPFDKSLMDGYAVRAADVSAGLATLEVIEQVTAGQAPQRTVQPGMATQIMTGAPLPNGADAVVRVEDSLRDGHRVEIRTKPVTPGQNILRQGTALKIGERILSAGAEFTPSRIGALAELGCAMVPARRRPTVAVLATGDELVPVETTPNFGQIRNSNEPMLAAQMSSHGANVVRLGIARDEPEQLAAKIREGLQCDVLVLSGGVSAGTLDLVPSTLAAAGVSQVFHKVDLKPGKPVWFGVRGSSGSLTPVGRGDGQGQGAGRTSRSASPQPSPPMSEEQGPEHVCYVFGLPGNPVGSLVCCELFVRTAIRRLMGFLPAEPVATPARLVADVRHRSDRPTYHPACLSWTPTGLSARLVTWHGSADLRATVEGNGMVLLPTGEREYQAGEEVAAYWWG